MRKKLFTVLIGLPILLGLVMSPVMIIPIVFDGANVLPSFIAVFATVWLALATIELCSD